MRSLSGRKYDKVEKLQRLSITKLLLRGNMFKFHLAKLGESVFNHWNQFKRTG